MLVTPFLIQEILYLSGVIGDGVVVTAGDGLSVLSCCDSSDELCGIVTVQDRFELSDQFWVQIVFSLPKDFVWFSVGGRVVPSEGTHDWWHADSEYYYKEYHL